MYTKYVYNAGATSDNIKNDIIAILTGETNKANLSASCNKSSTDIFSTIAAGWTSHDTLVPNTLAASKGFGVGNQAWKAIVWTGQQFVAMANSICATSPDGVTWTMRTAPALQIRWMATNGNGTVIAMTGGINSTVCGVSTDHGNTWGTVTLSGVSAYWSGVAWNGSIFCAIGSGAGGTGGTNAATSPDGLIWTAQTLPVGAVWSSIATDGTKFCIVGTGTISLISTTGATGTWTQGNTLPSYTWNNIVWSPTGNRWIAFANNLLINYYMSSDGLNWTLKSISNGANFNQNTLYAYGNTVIIATSSSTSYVYKSSDGGLTFSQFALPVATFWGIGTYNGTFGVLIADGIAVGGNSTLLHFVTDKTETCLKSPIIDTAGYKYFVLSTQLSIVQLRGYETWDATAHTGTNLCYYSDSTSANNPLLTLSAGGTLYISASARHVCMLSSAGNITNNGPVGIFERSRMCPWDISSNNYPPFIELWFGGMNGYASRLLNNAAADVTGSTAVADIRTKMFTTYHTSLTTTVPASSTKDIAHLLMPINVTNVSFGFIGEISNYSGFYFTTYNFGNLNDEVVANGNTYVVWSAGSNRLAVLKV